MRFTKTDYSFIPVVGFYIGIALILSLSFTSKAFSERIFFAGYKGGFYIKSEEEGGMELRLGGAFQGDYRYYNESQRADNRFDIRRARLVFRGKLTRWIRFGMEYEFQGNETDNLLDAWAEGVNGNHALRFGQYKQPFSLEWQTRDKATYFAERSMANSLSPKRDIGLMLHGSLFMNSVHYATGFFNGDGEDGSTRGNQEDGPELAGRLTLSPFKALPVSWLNTFQIGGSATYAKIDTANVSLHIKSTGMGGSSRNIYELSHNTKFGVLQSVDKRIRAGLEAAWAIGSVAVTGEYIHLKYTDLEPAGEPPTNADFSSWYTSFLWNITGEPVVISKGVLKPVYPHRFFNPDEGTWGAFCLGIRAGNFSGDKDWINPASYVSTENADAYSLALNWVLFPMCRIIIDYTHTDLSDPIRVRVLPDGEVDYIEKENVITARFSIDF